MQESGEEFNLSSTKQLAEVLFKKMKMPPGKKTKTGYSTDSDVLEKLSHDFPICQDIIEFRELSKLKSTYVDALPVMINKETNRLHTHFNQAVTTTGRLSSTNPNLQNIPIRTPRGSAVRQAFVAAKGYELISADYSQIELRILAHITDDPNLCDAFDNGEDVHMATAIEVFGVKAKDVTPTLRRSAKAVNFGIAYGMGAFGLAENLKIDRTEAQDIIKKYFQKFPKVQEYMHTIVEEAKKNGFVETLFGRRRYLPELSSKNGNIRKFGERAAINAPMQGTTSDIVKKAMIEVFQQVESKILLQVHDELIFECKKSRLDKEMITIKRVMEDVVFLRVPLVVDMSKGLHWGAT